MRTGGRWVVAGLTASALLTTACTASVDPGGLPGVYRNAETGGEIRLDTDQAFSATDVETGYSSGPADFSGRWGFQGSQTSSDFVYLSIEDDGLGRTGGIQLYTGSEGTVYFRADPDGPPSLVLTRTTDW